MPVRIRLGTRHGLDGRRTPEAHQAFLPSGTPPSCWPAPGWPDRREPYQVPAMPLPATYPGRLSFPGAASARRADDATRPRARRTEWSSCCAMRARRCTRRLLGAAANVTVHRSQLMLGHSLAGTTPDHLIGLGATWERLDLFGRDRQQRRRREGLPGLAPTTVAGRFGRPVGVPPSITSASDADSSRRGRTCTVDAYASVPATSDQPLPGHCAGAASGRPGEGACSATRAQLTDLQLARTQLMRALAIAALGEPASTFTSPVATSNPGETSIALPAADSGRAGQFHHRRPDIEKRRRRVGRQRA